MKRRRWGDLCDEAKCSFANRSLFYGIDAIWQLRRRGIDDITVSFLVSPDGGRLGYGIPAFDERGDRTTQLMNFSGRGLRLSHQGAGPAA